MSLMIVYGIRPRLRQGKRLLHNSTVLPLFPVDIQFEKFPIFRRIYMGIIFDHSNYPAFALLRQSRERNEAPSVPDDEEDTREGNCKMDSIFNVISKRKIFCVCNKNTMPPLTEVFPEHRRYEGRTYWTKTRRPEPLPVDWWLMVCTHTSIKETGGKRKKRRGVPKGEVGEKKDKRVREGERTEGGGETEKRERRRKETERESGRESEARLEWRKGLSPEIGMKKTMNAGGVEKSFSETPARVTCAASDIYRGRVKIVNSPQVAK
ncbi:hypothetical protein TNCV_2173981 [Trichonephila clavipes]|nr:hypothetical protein TNCV_2173981 [Trichonephila clavipes]